jgi:hypothetical protein
MFDITLTENFQYRSHFVDTENIKGNMSKIGDTPAFQEKKGHNS